MKAPPGTTIIATPLANCWLERQMICVDNVNCDRTPGNVSVHYKILEGIAGRKKMCWLKSFPGRVEFDSAVRSLAATMLPQICEALAIVASPGAADTISHSYSGLRKLGVPVEVFQHEDAARRWLRSFGCQT